MNRFQFLLFPFVLLFAAGCANHLITSDDFESKDDYYGFLNTVYAGDEIEIHLMNDSIQTGFLSKIERDSIHIQQTNEIDSTGSGVNIYAMKDIHQIKYYRSQRLEGFLIGAGAGMITGAIWEPFGFSSNSGRHVEASSYYGIGGLGGITGIIIGSYYEKEIVFLINPK